jgi:hypothetical protein
MATAVTPTNIQKMEFDVTTAEGPSRVTVVTGIIPGGPGAFSNSNSFSSQSLSMTALVDPTLTPGQFRKATATAALATTAANTSAAPSSFQFSVDGVEASLDDETGRIELRVDATAGVSNGNASIQRITFQVTTLAKI